MKSYGLIGSPLKHSFSRNYFTEKFITGQFGECHYNNFEIENLSELKSIIESDKSLMGLNVTIPHKVGILTHLDYISPEATMVGAVNVIKIVREKNQILLKGYNSDVYGFKESLIPLLDKSIINALILGTGGAARAAAYALTELGIKSTFVSRREGDSILGYSQITRDIMDETGLIVNATPVGMFPDLDSAPPINYSLLNSQILFDMIYNPSETLFMKKGRDEGCRVKGGEEMLIRQAEKSWEIWNSEDY